jgi:hypothetical protein
MKGRGKDEKAQLNADENFRTSFIKFPTNITWIGQTFEIRNLSSVEKKKPIYLYLYNRMFLVCKAQLSPGFSQPLNPISNLKLLQAHKIGNFQVMAY